MSIVSVSIFGGIGAQFFDNNGNPLSGGKIESYEAGTSTPLPTYTSITGITAHTNPIVLDSSGRVPSGGEIWVELQLYKFVLKTSANLLIATYDNVGSSSMVSGETANVFDYIPRAEHLAIQNNTSTYDCTEDIALAISENSAVSPGTYGKEKTIVFPQGLYCVKYIDLTAKRDVWLFTNGYVIIKGVDSSVKNFVFGATNYNPVIPENSTSTTNCFLGGPGQWEFFAAPSTSYQYGMRLEAFTSSTFENVSAGSGYVAITDVNNATGNVVAAYLNYTYSNIFTNCGFSCPTAPPEGKKSFGIFMDSNNVNSNTFIRCNGQGANVTVAPYANTVGVNINGSNNVFDNCDFSALDTAFFGGGSGGQIRNTYSEYVTTFLSGPFAGQLLGCVVQGGFVEIVNDGNAFVPQNTENLTIIGGRYRSAFSGSRTFINQAAGTSPNTLYGVSVINPNLAPDSFSNFITGTYRNGGETNILQTRWLTFPSTQVATTEPNTLDDYEEGTWTPTKPAGAAFTSSSGNYTKIGNLVTATFLVEFPSEVSSVAASIVSFPFSAMGGTAERNGLALGYNTSSVNVGGSLSVTTMNLRIVGAGGGSATSTQMSGSFVSGTITYTIL